MKQYNIRIWLYTALALLGFLPVSSVSAQNGAGTSNLYTGLYIGSGAIWTDAAETIYIGPGTYTVDGTWNIYGTGVWIHPDAQILGAGKIVFLNPDDNAYYPDMAGTTIIDHNNGMPIHVMIEHYNPNNIILGDITDPGFGTVNPSGSLAAALHVGGDFWFMVDNGDVMLNGNDFVFDNDATLNGYSENRMVVTNNSIAGHMRKENTVSAAFTFPVGIAEGDYTPVTITGNNTYNVSVQDYATGTPFISAPLEGVDRLWHIYGGVATAVTLQHKSGAGGSDGTGYNDANAFITRYQGAGVWSGGIIGVEQTAAGVHTNATSIPSGIPLSGTADASYLTKTSDAPTPLPVRLLNFDAYKKADVVFLDWSTASEQNNHGFNIERSENGRVWTTIGFVKSQYENGNSDQKSDYHFTDTRPLTGTNLYRLKQVDLAGGYEYSEVRAVDFDKESNINIYPNPATDLVSISGLNGDERIVIYDVSGRAIYQESVEKPIVHVSLEGLSPGIHQICIIHANGSRSVHKLVKIE